MPTEIGLLVSLGTPTYQVVAICPPANQDACTEDLGFPFNRLVSTLPSSLSSLTKLTRLELWRNALTGTLPLWISDLSRLSEYERHKSIATRKDRKLCTDKCCLDHLDLSVNFLDGTIPSELGKLTNTTYLNLEHNRLWGTIPSEIGMLTKLGK